MDNRTYKRLIWYYARKLAKLMGEPSPFQGVEGTLQNDIVKPKSDERLWRFVLSYHVKEPIEYVWDQPIFDGELRNDADMLEFLKAKIKEVQGELRSPH